MRTKYDMVLADTSCFILLDKIRELSLLEKIFDRMMTTPEVLSEFIKPLPDWVKIQSPKDHQLIEVLAMEVDKGEASVIALALENKNTLLILDDYKARKVADKLRLNYTGTLGIILKAKETGIIPDVKTVLEKIQQTNFRFSERIFQDILRQANEQP